MQTEQRNPRSKHIDQLPTLDVLRIMNDEDATVAAAVREALPDIARAVDVIVERIGRGGRLIYVGAGTSGRLAVVDASECVPTFSVDPSLVRAVIAGGMQALVHSVEGAEDDIRQGRADVLALDLRADDVVVGLAASGRTPYVLGALAAAREVGAATVGVSCNRPAPLLEAADIGIAVVVGPEVITGSTRLKAGTAQKMILNMLSTATMIRLGKVYGNRMVDVMVSNEKLARRARGIVADVAGVSHDEAARLLEESGQEVKTAIVMSRLGLSASEARARLNEAGGRLALVIGESKD
ncbi:MAG: N-acetylmuramic acid 6-phosphate etherase [Chloroflexota bacterium]